MTREGLRTTAFAIHWGTAALLAWSAPFLLYWMAPPHPVTWGTNHGPWRGGGRGELLELCDLALILLVPAVVARGTLLSVRWRTSSPLLIALGLAVLATGLIWHQVSALYWLID